MPICICGSPCGYVGMFSPENCTNPKCQYATKNSSPPRLGDPTLPGTNITPQKSAPLLSAYAGTLAIKVGEIERRAKFCNWVLGWDLSEFANYTSPVIGLWNVPGVIPKPGFHLSTNCCDIIPMPRISSSNTNHWVLDGGSNPDIVSLKYNSLSHYIPNSQMEFSHYVFGTEDEVFHIFDLRYNSLSLNSQGKMVIPPKQAIILPTGHGMSYLNF